MHDIYIIEGLDRLGKSTLIKEIQHQNGFYQVIHFGKPEVLDKYNALSAVNPIYSKIPALEAYQRASFRNMFKLMSSNVPGTRLIFDRAHLGEHVYAPMYRGYSGDYIFELEDQFAMQLSFNIRMILLVEDFNYSKHFVEDGESFDPTKRVAEQKLFKEAFDKSIIKDKRIVCVTEKETGGFRSKLDIFLEATQ